MFHPPCKYYIYYIVAVPAAKDSNPPLLAIGLARCSSGQTSALAMYSGFESHPSDCRWVFFLHRTWESTEHTVLNTHRCKKGTTKLKLIELLALWYAYFGTHQVWMVLDNNPKHILPLRSRLNIKELLSLEISTHFYPMQ